MRASNVNKLINIFNKIFKNIRLSKLKINLSLTCQDSNYSLIQYFSSDLPQLHSYSPLISIPQSCSTFFCGFIFAKGEDAVTGFYILSTIIIFVCNGIFFLKWLFLMLIEFKWKNQHFQRTLEIFAILLLKEKNWRKERFKVEDTPMLKKTPVKEATKKPKKGKKRRRQFKKILKNGVKNAKNNKLNAKLYKIKALDNQFSSMRVSTNSINKNRQSDNRLVLNSKTSRKQYNQSEENRVKLPEHQKDISQLIIEMSHEEEKNSTPQSLFKNYNERKIDQREEESKDTSMQEVFGFTTENRKNRRKGKKKHHKRNDSGHDQEEDEEEKEEQYHAWKKGRRS